MELYKYIGEPFFAFKKGFTQGLFSLIEYIWSATISFYTPILGVMLYTPYAYFADKEFMNKDLGAQMKQITAFIEESMFFNTIIYLPTLSLMLLEISTAAIALGLTINKGGNLLYNFQKLLKTDCDSLKQIKNDLNNDNAYDKIFPEGKDTSSWTAMQNAWNKDTYTNLTEHSR